MSQSLSVGRQLPATLVGHQFKLVPLTEEHITARHIGWLNNPEVNRFLEVRFVRQSRETVLAYVRSFYGDTEKYIWGIYTVESAELVGTVTLASINRHHGLGEIGLMIGDQGYWGAGASTEAFDLVAGFAFETLGLRRMTGGNYATNFGMNFTFKRLGFTLEGKLRKNCMVDPGTYVDGYRWGILADEWKARSGHQSNRSE